MLYVFSFNHVFSGNFYIVIQLLCFLFFYSCFPYTRGYLMKFFILSKNAKHFLIVP